VYKINLESIHGVYIYAKYKQCSTMPWMYSFVLKEASLYLTI